MNVLSKISHKLQVYTYKQLQSEKQLQRLQRANNGPSKGLANAIAGVVYNTASADERAWIDKIETLRKELDSSSQSITVRDFGAGSADSALTNGEMYQGQVKVKTVGAISRHASKSPMWGLLLFRIIREFKPSVCLELGTCFGVSAAYQAAAAELNQHGTIVTLEGAESFAAVAQRNLERLGLTHRAAVRVGRFQNTLGEVLSNLGHVDYAFIDGHHDGQATLAYFEQIFPFLSETAVLVFDDIAWSKDMAMAWNTIVVDERIGVAIDLFSVGICTITKAPVEKQTYKIALT